MNLKDIISPAKKTLAEKQVALEAIEAKHAQERTDATHALKAAQQAALKAERSDAVARVKKAEGKIIPDALAALEAALNKGAIGELKKSIDGAFAAYSTASKAILQHRRDQRTADPTREPATPEAIAIPTRHKKQMERLKALADMLGVNTKNNE